MFREINGCRLELTVGDITTQPLDAVVNAANAALAGGGGVDGAIHRAAGPSVMRQTRTDYPNGCPTGSAVLTAAGELPAGHIIHAVGPQWGGGLNDEEADLRAAYRRSLELAVENGLASVAFPAISCGVYGYPLDLAACQAIGEVAAFLADAGQPEIVRFVLFSDGVFGAFAKALDSLGDWPGS